VINRHLSKRQPQRRIPGLDSLDGPVTRDNQHVGAASGVLTTGLQVGNAIGVAVIGVIFYAGLQHSSSDYAYAFVSALAYLIAMSVALIGLVQLLPSRRSCRRAQGSS
jgi:hypothetical protein